MSWNNRSINQTKWTNEQMNKLTNKWMNERANEPKSAAYMHLSLAGYQPWVLNSTFSGGNGFQKSNTRVTVSYTTYILGFIQENETINHHDVLLKTLILRTIIILQNQGLAHTVVAWRICTKCLKSSFCKISRWNLAPRLWIKFLLIYRIHWHSFIQGRKRPRVNKTEQIQINKTELLRIRSKT